MGEKKELRRQIAALLEQVEELTEALAATEAANAEHAQRAEEADSEVDSLFRILESDWAALEEALERLELGYLGDYESCVAAVVRHLEALKAQCRQLTEATDPRIISLEVENESLREEMTGLHRALDLARSELQSLARFSDVAESELHDLGEDYVEVSARSSAWWDLAKVYCRAWRFAHDEWIGEHAKHRSLKAALRTLSE